MNEHTQKIKNLEILVLILIDLLVEEDVIDADDVMSRLDKINDEIDMKNLRYYFGKGGEA